MKYNKYAKFQLDENIRLSFLFDKRISYFSDVGAYNTDYASVIFHNNGKQTYCFLYKNLFMSLKGRQMFICVFISQTLKLCI